MSTRGRSLLAGCTVAALGALGALGAAPSTAYAEPAADDDPLEVLFVLDVSGSMARATPDASGTLLDGAKAALTRVGRSLPAEVALGLRVYGAGYAGDDRSRSCQDTELVVPPQPASTDRLVDATRDLEPTGDTPIGRSLLAAADDFGRDDGGRRIVVLISDGEDTCHPPGPAPCEAARSLSREQDRLRVETVGLALRGQRAAVDELRCVARVTGGRYYGADNARALSSALGRIADGTIQRLGDGRRVRGGQRPDSAARLRPGGHRDTLRPGATKWYRFRARTGDRPVVQATVKGRPGLWVPHYARDCRSWEVRLYNPYGEGGTYPPYGNTGVFDGTGLAATGVETTGAIAQSGSGIDFPGTWRVSVSLARTAIEECADHLPLRHDFPFHLRVSLEAEPGDLPVAPESAAPSAAASAGETDGSAEPAASSGPPGATAGGDDGFVAPALPAEPTGAADSDVEAPWTAPLTVVLVAALLGAIGYLVVRWRRSRYF